MKSIALGFLCGVLALQGMRELPVVHWCWLLPLCLLAVIYLPRLRFVFAAMAGFLWVLLSAHNYSTPGLHTALEGIDLEVTGTLSSIPVQQSRATRFLFDIDSLNGHSNITPPERVRLHWYQDAPDDLRPGQRWQLTVRLKRPHGFSNPGSFDYEAWLFRQGIQATGYVRESDTNLLLEHSAVVRPLDQFRHKLAGMLERHASDNNFGVLAALSIGERQSLDRDRWDLLIATGTNHLLAISGLHIGMIAGMAYFIILHLWRLSSRLCRRYPAQRMAAIAAIAAALLYAALAGFSIPTQRALIMLVVFMSALLMGRALRPAHSWWLALLLVLVWEPLSVLSPGFWLSFLAVGVLLLMFVGRPVKDSALLSWGRIQLLLAIALIPLTLLIFSRVSLVMPVANLLAVPWVGFVVLPLALSGTVLIACGIQGGEFVLMLASHALDVLWWFLEWLTLLPHAQWFHTPPQWTAIPAVIGVLLLLAPRGWPARWLGVVLLVPMLHARPEGVEEGAFRVTLLDVGQGLSMVVQTASHSLVYDTGARFSEQFDSGESVVLPFLRQAGIRRVDMLILSHEDNDHAGGAESLLQGVNVDQILTSAPAELDHINSSKCLAGRSWQWDGVNFELLHPGPEWSSTANNRSCVLRVSHLNGSVLITGDIQAQAELHLINHTRDRLDSDVLLVPHHGSNTSSTHSLLDTVSPQWALVAAGYRNRWDFPRTEVLERYQARGIEVLNTASSGAIQLDVSPRHGIVFAPGYRQSSRRYWSSWNTGR